LARHREAVIVVRYMGLVDVSQSPSRDQILPADFYAALPANNFIDRLVYDRLSKLGFAHPISAPIPNSIRRASLDAIGKLLTPEEVKASSDQDPTARQAHRPL